MAITISMNQKAEGDNANVRFTFSHTVCKDFVEMVKAAYEVEIIQSGYIKSGVQSIVIAFVLRDQVKILQLREAVHRALLIADNHLN